MKNKTFFSIVIILTLFTILSCVSSTKSSKITEQTKNEPIKYSIMTRVYEGLPQDTENMRFREYGKGFLIFNFFRSTLFMLQNSEVPTASCIISYKPYGSYSQFYPEQNLNKIRIDYVLTNFSLENITPVEIDGKIVRKIKIKVGESEYIFDFAVEIIPISLGIKYNDFIKILGQPDDEMKGITDTWKPDDVRFYNPDLNNRYRSYWILRYRKYPYYAFRFNENGILIDFGYG
jgi:hypothetical protein